MGSCSSTEAVVEKKPMTKTDLHKQELRLRRRALKNASQEDVDAFYEDYYRHDELLVRGLSNASSFNEQDEQQPAEQQLLNVSSTVAECNCQHCLAMRQSRQLSPLNTSRSAAAGAILASPHNEEDTHVRGNGTADQMLVFIGVDGANDAAAGGSSPRDEEGTVGASSSIGNVDTPLMWLGDAFGHADANEYGPSDTCCRRTKWALTRAQTHAKLTRKRPPPIAV